MYYIYIYINIEQFQGYNMFEAKILNEIMFSLMKTPVQEFILFDETKMGTLQSYKRSVSNAH